MARKTAREVAAPAPKSVVVPPLKSSRGGRIAKIYQQALAPFVGAERTIAEVAEMVGVPQRDIRLALDRARAEGHETPRLRKNTFTVKLHPSTSGLRE